MRTVHKSLLWMAGGLCVAVVVASAFSKQTAQAGPPQASSTSASDTASRSTPASVERGKYLVAMGDCVACHTHKGGKPFAGGRPLQTPFGTVLSANLTPDAQTGIGRYTADTFYRAMSQGVDDDEHHLYPAFPYNYYTKITRDDSDAMFAYLRTLPPVSHALDRNRLPFPFNIRAVMVVWNWMFLDKGTYQPDTTKSAEWNRGAYLVEGLAHCAACHTPKNILGGNKSSEPFYGGRFGEWFAPDITPNQRVGIGSWKPDELFAFLHEGHNVHSAASGEMGEVVGYSTSQMTRADLAAVITYLGDVKASPVEKVAPPDTAVMHQGEAIWRDQCIACHAANAKGVPLYFPPLMANANLQQRNPTTVIHYILEGASKIATDQAPTQLAMPAFNWKLDDQQVAAVATYARNSFGNTASAVTAMQVADLRKKLKPIANTTGATTPALITHPGPGTLTSAGTSSTDNGTPQAGREVK
ncbi:cytochrome c [Variovorax sp. LG9.2]|uniref:c-type cytochrome n=1 Tax=Variovorax sp. LG9.2 TaxID=3048626 RepID=UPI002B2227C2|nr:cytochrome c [Variovorax sp. LG9.2]MEB0059704.1 cytochrome c [Variovorax sp. LG9.2]